MNLGAGQAAHRIMSQHLMASTPNTLENNKLSASACDTIFARAMSGSVEILNDRPEVYSIISFTERYLRKKIMTMFNINLDDDIADIHHFLSEEQRMQLYLSVHDSPEEVAHVPMEFCNLIRSLGATDNTLLSANVHFRIVFPITNGGGGAPPHRDSWYSLPAEGINIWIPCTEVVGNGIGFYPEYFKTGVRLGPKNPNHHHHEIREPDITKLTSYSPPLEIGECLIFSGNHLHRSMPNQTDRTRISWDYRALDMSTSRFYMRLNEFVFPDLILQHPTDLRRQRLNTIKRIFRTRPLMSIYMALTGSMFLFKVISRLKAIFPNVFYR